MKYISVGMRIHVGNSVWVKGPCPLGKGSLPMIGYLPQAHISLCS